ncbi:MAG: acyl-CoA dehydratase activase [Candidatus Aminicenantes bacterium]|nr:acyl-CoA dehydratase activase [Candidatus Aminicenantes bacterium]
MEGKPITAGIDFGSRTIKIVELLDGKIASFDILDTSSSAIEKIKEKVQSAGYSHVVATGYGRYLLRDNLLPDKYGHSTVTEIKACALGANFIDPRCRLVVDIGGQDFKIIEVKGDGSFGHFELNDRCAAGTGRFLEIMAQVLGYGIEEFGQEALKAQTFLRISSMCTVFAESEVISLLTSGRAREEIALAVHYSVVERLYPLIMKFNLQGDIMLVGGVALNVCIKDLLAKKLGQEIFVPENPQIIPALGAALIAFSSSQTEKENL